MSFSNLYHLMYQIKSGHVLVDKDHEIWIKETVYPQLDQALRERIQVHIVDHAEFACRKVFFTSALRKHYDLIVVHENNALEFTPALYLARYVFIPQLETANKKRQSVYTLFKKLDTFYDGVCYENPFWSLVFDKVALTGYEQTWIRDKPYRFLKMTQNLVSQFTSGSIVEIGSVRRALSHVLDKLNPHCCNDSHSTFFWCQVGLPIHTVDIQPVCREILETAYEAGQLKTEADLHVHVMDGIAFLRNYDVNEDGMIRLLFLDAWDVVEWDRDESFAKNHLEAYRAAKEKLCKTCFILIDDTDVGKGGKGKTLVPELLKDGFVILFKGRQTLLYRGKLDRLWSK